MIKKDTAIIFENNSKPSQEWGGGIPLAVNERLSIDSETFVVSDKKVEVLTLGEDQHINITYTLKAI